MLWGMTKFTQDAGTRVRGAFGQVLLSGTGIWW